MNYWIEAVSAAVDDAGLTATPDQIKTMAFFVSFAIGFLGTMLVRYLWRRRNEQTAERAVREWMERGDKGSV